MNVLLRKGDCHIVHLEDVSSVMLVVANGSEDTGLHHFALPFACLYVEVWSALVLVRGATGAVTGSPGMTTCPGRDARDADKLSGLLSD